VIAAEDTGRRLVIGVFPTREGAEGFVRRLGEWDFPLDWVSLLGRRHSAGDDLLGITYSGPRPRRRFWAGQGALWGGLWGVISGLIGWPVVPGLDFTGWGVLLQIPANGGVGAAIPAAVMYGAARATEGRVRRYRCALPEDDLTHLHGEIEAGRYVVVLRALPEDARTWRRRMAWAGAGPVWVARERPRP
jgi:hypothetical protein